MNDIPIEPMPLKRTGEQFPVVKMNVNEVWQKCVERHTASLAEFGEPETPRGYAWVNGGLILTCYMRWHEGKLTHHHNAFIDPWIGG